MMTTLAQQLTREHEQIDAAIAGTAQPAAAAAQHPALRGALSMLRRHIYLEETMLFPPMRGGSAFAAIFAMLREHGQMWPILDAIDAELERNDPDQRVVALLGELAQLLAAHNDKEERTIYSQADAALAGEPARELAAFLAGGAMPDGWRCLRAGAAAGPG